jgi:tRNA threonylcarbamoyl adenosine modification protein YeaZ
MSGVRTMKTILMDTSNAYLVIALYENDVCLDAIQEIGNRRQSEYAIVYLDNMLKKHHLEMLDIDEMIITIGPGSYTGVRVALSIVKTLGVTTNIKIKTVSSLLAFAGMQEAISVLDARSHKVFVGVFKDGKPLIEEQLLDNSDFDALVQQYPTYQIVGDGTVINQVVKLQNIAKNMYQVAKMQPYVTNIDTLVPHYIKEVEAKKIC